MFHRLLEWFQEKTGSFETRLWLIFALAVLFMVVLFLIGIYLGSK